MTDGDRVGDQAAVGEVLMKLAAGFRGLDASGLDEIYADDADWTNAFGTTKHGRDEIVAYLEVLFADEHFGAGRLVGPPQVSVRFLGDDVAVVKTYIEREGQETVAGAQLPIRRNHSLKVLERRHGRWLIVSEMYMDARDDQTLVQPSSAS
jgi:uncharacterized protein (TIGR02246 family)